MIGKKINQLATELAPASTDLTIIGNPTTGVSKKITLAQLGAIFSGAVSFYTNYASFPATGTLDVIFCAKDTQKLYLWSGSAYVEVFPSQALLDTYQLRSEKGNANGYASLDSSGKVPVSQLPSSIMEYKGTWSAATNTPTLANGTGDTGDVYICNAAGSVNFGAGAITFAVGDYVIYSGSIWQRSSGAVGTVTSVAASITGNAIGITGSPVTTSGTLALAFAGTSAQYVNGAGNLVTFPSIISQAQNIVSEVYNNTGATLTKGTIVYINGGQGNLPTVTKALATGDSTSAQTYGIVQADITNMNNGYVVVTGRLIDLDTQAYSNGTQLYLSGTTAGTWTSTKPYAPIHLVYVGIVVRSHPTQGVVEVKIQNGYELDEIHNVAAQTPSNNDGLFWEASTSLWKNKSISTVLGYTPQAQLNGTGFVKASGTTITYDNSTYLTTSAAATTYLPMVLSSTAKSIELNGQTFDVSSVAGSYTSGRLIVTPNFTAIGYQSSGVFKGLQISTDGTANFYNTGLTRFFNQVQFDSTLTNGTYTYTLPGATGTLALTSDIPSLSGYVPYTGATTNLNLGSNNLTAAAITGSSARITTLAGSVYADVNGNLGTTAGTQNTIAYWGSQYSLASLSTTTYPDLTELSYVKGVTSSIQTQLNSKQSTLTNPVTGTGTTNYLPKFTGTSTIGNSIISDDGTNATVTGGFTSSSFLRINKNGSDSLGAGAFLALYNTGFTAAIFQQLNASNGLDWWTTSSKLMTLNASGNLGLGVTPSAWNLKGFDIDTGGAVFGASNNIGLTNNAYYNSGWIYKNTATAANYIIVGSEHRWNIAPSGTAGNAISFTQAMTLNASGNLSIGNTNDTYKLDVSGTGRFTGNLTISNGGYIQVNGSSNGYLNLNAANAGGNEAGIFYQIGGTNKWENYTAANDSALNWYSYGTGIVFKLASSGAATFSAATNDLTVQSTGASSGTRLILSNPNREWRVGAANDGSFWAYDATAGQYRLYINSSGLVGIGTTSPSNRLTVIASNTGTQVTTVPIGKFVNTGNEFSKFIIGSDNANYDAVFSMDNNATLANTKLRIYIGNGTNSTAGHSNDQIVLTGSGNVGIGTTAPISASGYTGFTVYNATTGGIIQTTNGTVDERMQISTSAGYFGTFSNHEQIFVTNATERMRISSGGEILAGSTSAGLGFVSASKFGSYQPYTTDSNSTAISSQRTAGMFAVSGGDNSNNQGSYTSIVANVQYGASNNPGAIFRGYGNTTLAVQINYNGNITNTNNSYGAISDISLKENISDTTSKLADLLKVKVRNYNLIGDDKKQIGVIAQELETIFPSMIEKNSEGLKSVKYSVFVPMLIKAIQELNDKIK